MNSRLKRFFLSKKTAMTGLLVGAIAMAALIPAIAFAAYSGIVPWTSSDALRLDGSTTVFPIVAKALGVSGTGGLGSSGDFQGAGHSGLQAHVEEGGSGVGKADAEALAVDIGDASSITDLATTGPHLTAWKIARDGICIIVNKNGNTLANITKDELKRIFNAYYSADANTTTGTATNPILNDGTNGTPGIKTDASGAAVTSTTPHAVNVNGTYMLPPITSWADSEFGVSGGQSIVAVGRIVGSGTRDAIIDFLHLDKGQEVATNVYEGSHRIDSNADLASFITGNQWTIGYVGIGYTSSLPSTVTTMTVNGIKATAQNVCTTNVNKLYPMSRYLYLLLNSQYATNSQTNANRSNAEAFVNWMRTKAGQDIVEGQNFIRLTPLADISQDGTIDVLDLGKLGKKWNKATSDYQTQNPGHYSGTLTAGDPADINGDGVVDVLDLGKLGKWWNVTYGTEGSLDTLTPDYPAGW